MPTAARMGGSTNAPTRSRPGAVTTRPNLPSGSRSSHRVSGVLGCRRWAAAGCRDRSPGREDSRAAPAGRVARPTAIALSSRAYPRPFVMAADRHRCVVVAVLAVGLVRAWDHSRQLPTGDGWQLLGRQRGVGDRNQVRLIGDQAGLDAAWTVLRLTTGPTDGRLRTIGRGLAHAARYALLPESPGRDPVRSRPERLVDGAFSLGLSMGCRQPLGRRLVPRRDRPDRLPPPPYQVRILGPDPPDTANGQLHVDR